MERIEGDLSGEISEIKRCYVKDAIIKINCPNCGRELKHDFSERYLSYPEVGKKTYADFYCESCDEKGKECEFELPIEIASVKIVIWYDSTKLEKQ